jgi:hypothetical protein
MGEIAISPYLNVHENYRTMNIINPYRFGSVSNFPIDGLIAYWPFSNNLNDLSGNNYNLSSLNAPSFVTDRKGISNSAVGFNGSSNYLERVPLSPLYAKSATKFTISFWIYLSSFPSGNKSIYDDTNGGDTTNGGVHFIYASKTFPYMSYKTTTGYVVLTIASNVISATGTWYHIIFTGGDGVDFRVNNVSKVTGITGDATKPYVPRNNNLIIGKHRFNPIWYWPGYVDDIFIYNRVLSASEITQLYNL